MLLSLLRPLRGLVRGLHSNDSPRQLALGIAVGMLIGLVPKGNLIALSLVILLFSVRINRGTGLCSAFLFSWVGSLLDPMSHRIGFAILGIKPLELIYTWLYDLPIVPWTSFHNTVVLGSLVIGVGLFYPVYRGSKFAFQAYAPLAVARLSKYKVSQVLFGTDLATRWKIQ